MEPSDDKELTLLRRAAAEFARLQLAPKRQANDACPFGPFFEEVVEKAFSLDFFHLTLPQDLGGTGHGITALCRVLEAFSREDASLAGILFTHTLAQAVVLAAGEGRLLKQRAQKAKAAREWLMAAAAFNNPGEIRTGVRADPGANAYCLSGRLPYLVMGAVADRALIPAAVDGHPGYSFFLVDLESSRARKSPPVLSLGFHACPAVDVDFDRCPGEILGGPGGGPALFGTVAPRMGLAAAAVSLGIMGGALDEAVAYTRRRRQGGRAAIRWSELQMILAEMAVRLAVAEMAVSRACLAAEAAEPGWERVARAAEIFVTQAACEATVDGVQALGGVGYMKDFGQEKRLRDAQQAQSLLGLAPLKKLRYFRQTAKLED